MSERVLAVIGTQPPHPSDRWRIELPFRALILNGYDAWVADPKALEGFQHSTLIRTLVQPRICVSSDHGAREIRRQLDTTRTRWVIDLDDRLDILPKDNEYRASNPPWSWTVRALKQAHAVTVSTRTLATWLRLDQRIDCPIHVLPNRVTHGLIERQPHDRLTVGLIGSPSHLHDWRSIQPALEKLIARFPDVLFLIMGCPIDLDGLNVQRLPVQTWGSYLRIMGQVDIGLCPLTPSEFNRGKSCLKWVEWGSIGVPCVVSPTVFGEVIRNGDTGLIATSQNDWESLTAALILNPDLRSEIGSAVKSEITRNWTENAQTCEARWRAYIGEPQWTLASSSVPSSSESRRSLSLV